MKEYDIYLPMASSQGGGTDASKLEEIKGKLAQAFGGYTHFRSRNEGLWRMGSASFRDEVTIIRVLDDGSAKFDMSHFKKELERDLEQESILIVAHEVSAVI